MNKIITSKNIIIAVLFFLTSGLVGFSIAPYSAANGGIQKIVKGIIGEALKDLEEKVGLNSEFRVDEYIKLITKNAKKIASDPGDVKRYDIDLCISYLGKIPEERKTESVKSDIELIVRWDREHP